MGDTPFGLPVKGIAVVRAGVRVTLVVPREQRRWMLLDYRPPHGNPTGSITLQACQSRTTQFGGGFLVGFHRAPDRARCAELIVRVAGSDAEIRKRLFAPRPGRCSGARPRRS
jgi:hypothetical protein